MNEIDSTTIERAKQGNALAFRSLYAHYSPFVWRLCYRSANGDTLCAEEIMQNTFIKVHRYLGSFSSDSTFSTWLYKVTYNCINEHFSRASRYDSRMVRLEEDSAACASPGSYEDSDLVRRILAPLTEAERFLLTAREVDGMSYEELAEVFGLSEGALRTRIARLKSDIREHVERLDREPVVGI